MDKKNTTLTLVQMSMFVALIILMAYTPLGYINIGPVLPRITLIHIVVSLGSVLMGPQKGAVLGGVFGLTSFLTNTFQNAGSAMAFMFTPFATLSPFEAGDLRSLWSLVICFVPRILVGVIPYFVFKGIRKWMKDVKTSKLVASAVAGFSGALTNTIFVMGFTLIFYKDAFESAKGVVVNSFYSFVTTVVGINGLIEAVVGAIVLFALCPALLKTRMFTSKL